MNIEGRTTVGNRVAPVAVNYHETMRLCAWPRDPHGWVYLGRAVDIVGKSMFPGWKPYSAYGLLPDVLVGAAENHQIQNPEQQMRYADWLINVRRDDTDFIYRADKPFAYLEMEPSEVEITDDDWNLACDMSQEEWSIGLGNQRMFREVQERIVEEAEAGRIVIGSRPLRGGEPKATPVDWWFTDYFHERFNWLAIDPDAPFEKVKPTPQVAHQLFVLADSLTVLNSGAGTKNSSLPAAQNTAHSPYLRLMLEVADRMRISPTYQPKKEEIVTELQARWQSYDLPRSANMLNSAATLLREPDSQGGRARKLD